MKVLIFHGYLLRGTGSNVYNANVAQSLARTGHDVHLLCQERGAASLPWVDAVGTWEEGRLAVRDTEGGGEAPGRVTAYLPDIGGLLPVYVADRYEGFESKTFPELTDEELERYIAANVAAVEEVEANVRGIDAALSNHLVMGPVILARAGLRFAAKVHGSALSYTVIPHSRFLPYAREGMEAASAVLVGSRHTAESLWETVGVESLPGKTRLGPPGVDIEAFSPLDDPTEGREILEALAGELDSGEESAGPGMGRDPALAARGLGAYAAAEGPRVIFVGKLIVSKGCDLLLAAWPLVHAANPGARLLLVGFGEYARAIDRLWRAIAEGDLDEAREIASRGRELEGGEGGPLRYLASFLAGPPNGYIDAARAAAGSVDLTGRLEYGEVARAVRASDALVVPSTFPEAFGMVAAEAAAAGALPVCAAHSGLAEVAGALADALPAQLAGLTSFELGPDAVGAIASRLNSWLALDDAERAGASAALVDVARSMWSWSGVANSAIAASEGRLEGLARVPSG
jgi:glycosyltransferase involved in cell wall biosynthesis